MEVFLRIEKGLPSVKDTSAIPGWIFRIARNLVIDHYREQRREVALPEQSLPNEAPEDLDNEAEREMARCVLAMLNHLPEATGTLLRWVDLEGMSQRAAAEKMELSPSGARSKVQRGRAQLKNMITECCSVERDRLGNILSHRCKDDRCC